MTDLPTVSVVGVPGAPMTQPIPQESFPMRLLHICERAMQDPSVPLDRFERIMATAKEAMEAEAKRQFNEDYTKLQAVLPTFEERGEMDAGRGGKRKYALWSDTNRRLRPLAAEYGFGLTFDIQSSEKGLTVSGTVLHRGGHSRTTSIFLPLDASGAKNIVQQHGSSVSYGKRYVASALFNLTSSAEADDDGMAAGGSEFVNEEQLAAMQNKIVEVGADIKALCEYFQVSELPKIPASVHPRVMAMLEKKAQQKQSNGG